MISVCILCHNEASQLEACITSVHWADEILVIDDTSTDESVAIAKRFGATVYTHELAGDFASQRNVGLQKAKNEWVLFIDADERVTESLKNEILAALQASGNRSVGYRLTRRDVLFGRELLHGETGGAAFIRLGRKDSGTWSGKVHEEWHLKGHIGILRGVIMHYPHPSVASFLASINFYTDLRAQELYAARVKSAWYDMLLYTTGKFVQNYLLRLGLLDGIQGLISALMMSFHSFLVRSKLWLYWQKKR